MRAPALAPIVTVSRTGIGRVTVKWFDGISAAERDDWVARATSQRAEVRGDHTSAHCLAATCIQSLLADKVDLRWRATHYRDRWNGTLKPVR